MTDHDAALGSAPDLRSASDLRSAPQRRRRTNWIARHWRGEFSLAASYWGMSILGGVVAAVATAVLVAMLSASSGYHPLRVFACLVATWAVSVLVFTWQLVGTWRSADRHIEAKSRLGRGAPWAHLAKVGVCLGFLRLLVSGLAQGAPQVAESFRMAFMDDPNLPAYAIRVMRNGTEAEITGGFKYGLTDDFVRIMRASPRIRVVHLDSLGGRIGEAEKLNAVIREKGLVTYVSGQCVSACTVAFAGGRERWIRRGASLGFHAPTFPGMTAADMSEMSDTVRTLYRDAGFAASVIGRALATPNAQLWRPTLEELVSGRVVTAVSDGSHFAASGYGANVTRDQIAKELARHAPALRAVQERLPADFARIVDAFHKGYEDGRPELELAAAARAELLPIYTANRPRADDQTLVDLARLLVEQYEILGARDPEGCYLYASGRGGTRNFTLEMPAALVQRELAIGERIISTAAERPEISDEAETPLWAKVVAGMPKSALGKLELLLGQEVPPGRYADFCEASTALFAAVTRLEVHEAGALLRKQFKPE